jgi:hypothetical protein
MHYVIGNVAHSVRVLRSLDAEVDQRDARRQEYIGPLLKEIVGTIDKDPEGLKPLLHAWESENVERLGLGLSRMPLTGPRLVVSSPSA